MRKGQVQLKSISEPQRCCSFQRHKVCNSVQSHTRWIDLRLTLRRKWTYNLNLLGTNWDYVSHCLWWWHCISLSVMMTLYLTVCDDDTVSHCLWWYISILSFVQKTEQFTRYLTSYDTKNSDSVILTSMIASKTRLHDNPLAYRFTSIPSLVTKSSSVEGTFLWSSRVQAM